MFKRFDPTASVIVLVSALVLVECVQLVIILGLVSIFIPIKMDPFNVDIFPAYQGSIKPNYQMPIYHIFIVSSILAQVIGIFAFRRKLQDKEFQNNILQLL